MTQTVTLGEVEIIRVVELELSTRPPGDMFPSLDPQEWERHRHWLDPDHWDAASGLLRSCMQLWVLRTGSRTIVIDTGVGNHKHRPGLPPFDHLTTDLPARLAAAGIDPGDVTDVVNTHLHADHVGWNTRLDDGEWVPTFPAATYHVPAADLDFWRNHRPHVPRLVAANEHVLDDSVDPIERAGLLRTWEGGLQLDTGVRLEPAPGHTPGSSVVHIESGGERAVFVGDVLHNAVQLVEPHLHSCFCEHPEEANRTRRRLLEWAADEGALVFAAHIGGGAAAEITRSGSSFTIDRWAFR